MALKKLDAWLKIAKKAEIRKKNAQIDMPVISFAIVIIFLVIMGPIMLKIYKETTTPLKNMFNDTSGSVYSANAYNAMQTIDTTWTKFWDFIIIMAFVINLILIVISAFLVESNPVFFVIFMVLSAITFMIVPNMIDAADKLWTSPQFSNTSSETSDIVLHMPFTNYLRTSFGKLLLLVTIVSGILMFSKTFRIGGKPKKGEF